MTINRKTIRILVEGEPEKTFLLERIIKKYKFCFPDIDFEVIKVGRKSILLGDEIIFRNFQMLHDPNIICFLLPDFHPITCHNLDHTDLNSLRNNIYNIIERIQPAHNIPDYRERFIIHFFKHGGDVIFLTNLDLLFEEFNINDENFMEEIREECESVRLEELPQNPDDQSFEKRLLKRILRKVGKSYTIKNLRNLIKKLRIEDLINKLPHFKLFLHDLFKFAEENEIPNRLRDLLEI